jgi:hypothetical protein
MKSVKIVLRQGVGRGGKKNRRGNLMKIFCAHIKITQSISLYNYYMLIKI